MAAAAAADGSSLKRTDAWKCFGGQQEVWVHGSSALGCEVKFSVFLPPGASADAPAPVLIFLSGLTCDWSNFTTKAGAQRAAAEQGICIVAPDTSPRGEGVPNDEGYDLGQGAGFYVDATREPWSTHFRMRSYILEELPGLLRESFPALNMDRVAVAGHSMGGHGALTLALSNPGRFVSASAFSPICNPTECPWGVKAFSAYFGDDEATRGSVWAAHDASLLARGYAGPTLPVLVDQGSADSFLSAGQLRPEALCASAEGNDRVALEYRLQEGYDHSYYFIATFVADHVRFHAERLRA